MPALILIPARYESSRFPGKPLVELRGASGIPKPLVLRSWEAATAASDPGDRVAIATDDIRIQRIAEAGGAECILTSSDCRNGTERCAEAAAKLEGESSFDVVVNLQGDAPLTPPWFIREIASALREAPDCGVATPVLACDVVSEGRLRADRRAGRVGATTAIADRQGRALYFSKEVLPYGGRGSGVLHHVGAYAYRLDALHHYVQWPIGELEAAEGLEQLRFLENGCPILCVKVSSRGRTFWEVNHPRDVETVEQGLRDVGIA